MTAEERHKLFVQVERATEVPMLLLAIVFLVAIAAPEVIDLSLFSSSPKNAPAASATKKSCNASTSWSRACSTAPKPSAGDGIRTRTALLRPADYETHPQGLDWGASWRVNLSSGRVGAVAGGSQRLRCYPFLLSSGLSF